MALFLLFFPLLSLARFWFVSLLHFIFFIFLFFIFYILYFIFYILFLLFLLFFIIFIILFYFIFINFSIWGTHATLSPQRSTRKQGLKIYMGKMSSGV